MTGPCTRAAVAALVLIATVAPSERAARAGGEVATAQVLFEDGKRLMARGRWPEACAKLAESQRLAPAIGTEFNLADCREHEGKLASAWAAFLDVVDQTHKRGEGQREAAARARAGALEPRLGKLTIQISASLARVGDVEVRRDGELIPREAWGVALPVDAGDHGIEVRAPAHVAWTGSAHTVDGGASTVIVPDLVLAPADSPPSQPVATAAAPANAPPSDDAPRALPPDRTAAFVVLGSAVLFAGVGAVGLVEHGANVSDYNADPTCPAISAPNRPARCNDYVSAASTWSTVGVLGFVAGGVATITGVALWITAPTRTAPRTAGRYVVCGSAGLGMSCGGVF
jgi:hypothetical protein